MTAGTSDTMKIPAWVEGSLEPIGKLEAHQRGLQHLAVSVFVVSGGDILIQQRAHTKYHTPGLWANTCCTHPHWGESTSDCAVRRLADELGITGLRPSLRHRVQYRADVGGGLIENEVVDVYVAFADRATLEVQPNDSEVADIRWINLYDLAAEANVDPDKFTPWLKIYLQDHMSKIFGTDTLI